MLNPIYFHPVSDPVKSKVRTLLELESPWVYDLTKDLGTLRKVKMDPTLENIIELSEPPVSIFAYITVIVEGGTLGKLVVDKTRSLLYGEPDIIHSYTDNIVSTYFRDLTDTEYLNWILRTSRLCSSLKAREILPYYFDQPRVTFKDVTGCSRGTVSVTGTFVDSNVLSGVLHQGDSMTLQPEKKLSEIHVVLDYAGVQAEYVIDPDLYVLRHRKGIRTYFPTGLTRADADSILNNVDMQFSFALYVSQYDLDIGVGPLVEMTEVGPTDEQLYNC